MKEHQKQYLSVAEFFNKKKISNTNLKNIRKTKITKNIPLQTQDKGIIIGIDANTISAREDNVENDAKIIFVNTQRKPKPSNPKYDILRDLVIKAPEEQIEKLFETFDLIKKAPNEREKKFLEAFKKKQHREKKIYLRKKVGTFAITKKNSDAVARNEGSADPSLSGNIRNTRSTSNIGHGNNGEAFAAQPQIYTRRRDEILSTVQEARASLEQEFCTLYPNLNSRNNISKRPEIYTLSSSSENSQKL